MEIKLHTTYKTSHWPAIHRWLCGGSPSKLLLVIRQGWLGMFLKSLASEYLGFASVPLDLFPCRNLFFLLGQILLQYFLAETVLAKWSLFRSISALQQVLARISAPKTNQHFFFAHGARQWDSHGFTSILNFTKIPTNN